MNVTEVKAIMTAIEREIHERWCGTPPSCGGSRDCEGAADDHTMRVVRHHLRAMVATASKADR